MAANDQGAGAGIDCSELLTAGHPRYSNTLIPGGSGGSLSGVPSPPAGSSDHEALTGEQLVGQEDEVKTATGQGLQNAGPNDPSGGEL